MLDYILFWNDLNKINDFMKSTHIEISVLGTTENITRLGILTNTILCTYFSIYFSNIAEWSGHPKLWTERIHARYFARKRNRNAPSSGTHRLPCDWCPTWTRWGSARSPGTASPSGAWRGSASSWSSCGRGTWRRYMLELVGDNELGAAVLLCVWFWWRRWKAQTLFVCISFHFGRGGTSGMHYRTNGPMAGDAVIQSSSEPMTAKTVLWCEQTNNYTTTFIFLKNLKKSSKLRWYFIRHLTSGKSGNQIASITNK